MTRQKITSLCLADLESAAIACLEKDCGARVTINLGTRKMVPDVCPSCGVAFDVKTRSVLIDLLNLYARPEVPSAKIILQVKKEEEKDAVKP
jgi:hypothetical protein